MISKRIKGLSKIALVSAIFLGTGTFAQYGEIENDSTKIHSENKVDESQKPSTTTETWSTDGTVSTYYDTSYSTMSIASINDLVLDLQTRLNLTEDQSDEIREALEEYQEHVAEIQEEFNEDKNDADENEELIGANEDFLNELREADEEANDEIEDALEEDQVMQYVSIKREWWGKVKDFVHYPAGSNIQTPSEYDTERNDAEMDMTRPETEYEQNETEMNESEKMNEDMEQEKWDSETESDSLKY